MAASDIPVPTPTPSVPRASQDEENVGNFDDHLQPFVQGKFYNHACYQFYDCFDRMISTFLLSAYFLEDGFDQPNSNISVANGSDGIDNQQGNGTSLPYGHNLVAVEVDRSVQPDDNHTEGMFLHPFLFLPFHYL